MRHVSLFEEYTNESDIRLIAVIPTEYTNQNQKVLEKLKWICLEFHVDMLFGSLGENIEANVYISPSIKTDTHTELEILKRKLEADSHYANIAMINLNSYDQYDMLDFEAYEEPSNIHEYEKVEILNFLNIKDLDEKSDEDLVILQQIYPEKLKHLRGRIGGKKYNF